MAGGLVATLAAAAIALHVLRAAAPGPAGHCAAAGAPRLADRLLAAPRAFLEAGSATSLARYWHAGGGVCYESRRGDCGANGAKLFRNASGEGVASRCCGWCVAPSGKRSPLPGCTAQEAAPHSGRGRARRGLALWQAGSSDQANSTSWRPVRVGRRREVPAKLPRIRLGRSPFKRHLVFKDDLGREVAFRGTNVVVKGPPWHPGRDGHNDLYSLVAEDFEALRSAGFNLIRLGVMWPGAEPERGRYNESYYEVIRGIVREAAEYGIYVLAEMHQDFLSEKYCGEGVPSWAAVGDVAADFPEPRLLTVGRQSPPMRLDAGVPSRQSCSRLGGGIVGAGTASSQFSYASAAAYEALYTNRCSLRDAWAKFWAKTAHELKGFSNVLGLELINEPWNGDVFNDPLLILPHRAESERLLPAYDALVAAIRAVDEEVLVFFGEVTGHKGLEVDSGNGFWRPPGGQAEANRSVLAFHYYRPPQDVDAGTWADSHIESAERVGTGLFMTESCCSHYLDYMQAGAARGGSFAQWEWKAFCNETREDGVWVSGSGFGACISGFNAGPYPDPDEALRTKRTSEEVDQWLRAHQAPYPIATQGTYLGSSWQADTHEFELHMHYDPQVDGATVLYINEELFYPSGCGGWQLEALAGAQSLEVRAERSDAPLHHVHVRVAGGGAQHVKLRVSPRVPCASPTARPPSAPPAPPAALPEAGRSLDRPAHMAPLGLLAVAVLVAFGMAWRHSSPDADESRRPLLRKKAPAAPSAA